MRARTPRSRVGEEQRVEAMLFQAMAADSSRIPPPRNALALPRPYDAIMRFEIISRSWDASSCKIAGGADDHRALDADRTCDEVGEINEIANAHGEVDILANKVHASVCETHIEV